MASHHPAACGKRWIQWRSSPYRLARAAADRAERHRHPREQHRVAKRQNGQNSCVCHGTTSRSPLATRLSAKRPSAPAPTHGGTVSIPALVVTGQWTVSHPRQRGQWSVDRGPCPPTRRGERDEGRGERKERRHRYGLASRPRAGPPHHHARRCEQRYGRFANEAGKKLTLCHCEERSDEAVSSCSRAPGSPR